MTQRSASGATTESKQAIAGIKKLIFGIAVVASVVVFGVWILNTRRESALQKQTHTIRLACPAGMNNGFHVKIPGHNKLSAKVSIPYGCDFRVLGDARKGIGMKTFPDEEIHTPGTVGTKKVYENNPEAIAFFSAESTDVTVVLFPLGTLKR